MQKLKNNEPLQDLKKPHLKGREITSLTNREIALLGVMKCGYSYCQVAAILAITERTVETHMKNIFIKLSVHSRSAAVYQAQVRGLLS